ncbi:MAG: T9SS type A sorting domain-containing protein [candidate division WOR-3 bacterium]|nr:MAG: T9SS type A sorting domain-containing protein [candidate division WOR-3 bacterium]
MMRNLGGFEAENVTGHLYTSTAGVTVTDPDVSFGNIPAYDSAWSQTGFGLELDPGLPDDYPVACSLVCQDGSDDVWVSKFELRSYAPVLVYVSTTIHDEGGIWPNGRLDPGETAEIEVFLENTGMGNAFEVSGILRSLDTMFTVNDSIGTFGTILSAETTSCTDRFSVTACPTLPPETQLQAELELGWDHSNEANLFYEFSSGGLVATDPITDIGPASPKYFAYDDGDVFYTEAPVYEWVELRGRGTLLELADQETKQVALPSAFGPFVFYDGSFGTISVCSNGWLAPGVTTDRAWQNRELPTTRHRSIVAPLWDDLLPSMGGGVLYWHDADNHRFVVEWDSVHYSWDRLHFDEFQILIYDSTMAAEDGNTEFVYQYRTAWNYLSATVGMQDGLDDPTGICVLFDGTYHRGSMEIEPGRAIKLTTDPPELTGIQEPGVGATRLEPGRLTVAPNPFSGNALIHWNLERDANVDLRVFDATGRSVRNLASGHMASGSHSAAWNGLDDNGHALARGIYFVRLSTPSELVETKTILAR